MVIVKCGMPVHCVHRSILVFTFYGPYYPARVRDFTRSGWNRL
jgi:hypothetical protein